MSISTLELAKARETASALLDELQLDAFIYEVEPRDDIWELTIECACDIDGVWETITLKVPKSLLLDSFDNENARHDLVEYWKKMLADCKLRKI